MGCNENKRAGRAYQSYIAKRLGGENVGTLGEEDVKHPLLSIECKKRKAFVALDWMRQCRANARDDKIPTVIIHVTGTRHSEDLVLISLDDFEDLFGTVRRLE